MVLKRGVTGTESANPSSAAGRNKMHVTEGGGGGRRQGEEWTDRQEKVKRWWLGLWRRKTIKRKELFSLLVHAYFTDSMEEGWGWDLVTKYNH